MRLLEFVRSKINKTIKPLACLLGDNLAFGGKQNQIPLRQVSGEFDYRKTKALYTALSTRTDENFVRKFYILKVHTAEQEKPSHPICWSSSDFLHHQNLPNLSPATVKRSPKQRSQGTPHLQWFHLESGTFPQKGPWCILFPFLPAKSCTSPWGDKLGLVVWP